MELQTNNLKYCRYSRKSSESKEKQVASIQDQNTECERYAISNRLNVTAKLQESKSAFKPHNRPQFDKMLEMISLGKINAILTWKPDRLCRNPEEGGILLQLLQDGKIKEIRTAMGDIYTQESDHLILQIHFGMANQYSRTISQNVRRGLNCKAERGEFTRPALPGYEGYGEIKKRLIKPHPFEAPIVQKLFETAKTGTHSLFQLKELAKNMGLKSKRGRELSKSRIYQLLTNPMYYGCFYHKGILYKGVYEPLISKRLFDEVQEALKNRGKSKTTKWEPIFNGLVVCKECGCAITTTVKKKNYKRTGNIVTYQYCHCTHRKGKCSQKPMKMSDLSDLFLEKFSKIKITDDVWELALETVKVKNKDEYFKNTKYIDHLYQKQKILQERIHRLIDLRADNEITKEEFAESKEEMLGEQVSIQELIQKHSNSNQGWLELAEDFLNTAHQAREIFEDGSDEEKRKLIQKVGWNLSLFKETLDFSYKKPYNVLLLDKFRSNGRA